MTHPIPDAALSQHVLIVGMTGAGKTYTAKGLAERLIRDGRRVCVIDPLGVWAGLRSSTDGSGPGLPVLIFGGEHGDVPIRDDMGRAVAGIVADASCPPSIIDLSEMSGGEMKRFMTGFASEVYKANRLPLHLFVDEADEFIPQQPMPDATVLSGEMDRIVRRGRARGFRVTMITQRPAVLHKNVVTQAATLVALRLVSKQDRDAVDGWIKGVADAAEGKRVLSALPGLDTGQGWVWSPQAGVLDLVTFPPISTYDSSRTPEAGHDYRAPTLASIDVAAIAEKLEALGDHQQAEKPRKSKADQDRMLADLQARHAEELKSAFRDGYLTGHGDAMGAAAEQIIAAARALTKQPAPDAIRSTEGVTPPAPPQPARQHRPAPAKMGGGQRRMLDVLVSRHPDRLTRAQWGTLAKLRHTGGTFGTYLSRLKGAGLVEDDGTLFWASDEAVRQFGADAPKPESAAAIREHWIAVVGSGAAGRLLAALVDEFPGWMRRETLATLTDLSATGGTFGTYLSRLRGNDLIEEDGGLLRASADLFMEPAP
ncbi:MAG: DUF87 domain-containing protein [Alphaproteobacteria bacterium]|nr:DUF87 domain-containing protein [Alphaproteobacteria bacterium]